MAVHRRSRALAVVLLTVFLATLALAAASLHWPEASGGTVKKKNGTVADLSHTDQGYVMVKQKATTKKLKLRLTRGDAMYTYDLNGEGDYEVFPLQMGSGSYKLNVFSQVKGTQYSQVSGISFKVKLIDENISFLRPNQYVSYRADSKAVALSEDVCAGLEGDQAKAAAVYDYLKSHILYNYIRALTVQSGYLPDLDQVLEEGMGICFDYAALMACMLRVQGIPTRLVIGYADDTYHAWNDVLIDGVWTRYDATAAATNMNVKTYTEERRY